MLLIFHGAESFYRFRLKSYTRIRNLEPEYFKNGTLKKQTEYIQLDMAQIMKELEPDETMEISEVYVGQIQKLPTRVIIYRLTNDETNRRLKNQAVREKRKGIVMKDKSKQLMGINVVFTNTSRKEVPTTYVHSLNSLRWQIEILFKTW